MPRKAKGKEPEAMNRGKGEGNRPEKPAEGTGTRHPEKPAAGAEVQRQQAQQPGKQRVQRTEAEWRKIRLEYVAGKTTLKKLAEKFHVSESTIRKKASTQGWKKRKNQVSAKMEQKAIARLCDARAKEFETIASVNDRMSDVLDYLLEFITEQPPTKYEDLRGVESLTKAIAQVVMVKRDLYNMPSEEQKAKIDALREKSKLEREKWKNELAEKAASRTEAAGTVWKISVEDGDEEEGPVDE